MSISINPNLSNIGEYQAGSFTFLANATSSTTSPVFTNNGNSQITFTSSGTFSGTATLQGSYDNSTWFSITALRLDNMLTYSTTINTTGQYWKSAITNIPFIRVSYSATSGGMTLIGYYSAAPYSPLSAHASLRQHQIVTIGDLSTIIPAINGIDNNVPTSTNGLYTVANNMYLDPNAGNFPMVQMRGDTRGLWVANTKFTESLGITLQSGATTGNGATYSNLDLSYTNGVFRVSGTFSATVAFEYSIDRTNWNALTVYDMSANGSTTIATSPGYLYTPLTLGTYYRARISGYTSGSVTVALYINNRNAITPNIDGVLLPTLQSTGLFAYNGTNYERIRTVAGVGDGATTGLAAEGSYGWNGAGWDKFRANNIHKYQEYLSLTNGQHLEIWTPAAGKKFRLMNVLFSSNYATGAKVTLRDSVGGTTAGAANLVTFNFNAKDTSSFQFGPNGYLSYQANNRLAVYNDSGATISIWLTFIGTEE